MKALTLWQPWATFIAAGAKTIETRHWSTGYRGPIAIHAGVRKDGDARDMFGSFQSLTDHASFDALPFGAVVAVAYLATVKPTSSFSKSELMASGHNYMLGNFAPGRFGWVLEDVHALSTPIPCKGERGLWDLPASIEALILAEWTPPAKPSQLELGGIAR